MRTCYRCLLLLHPPAFRRQFAGEMLWIFDQSNGGFALFADGVNSLVRQWLLRSGWWKIAIALALAFFQVGGVGLAFGRRHLLGTSLGPVAQSAVTAGTPLTVPMVMYLAVFLVGGLTVMTLGLTYWIKRIAAQRRPALLRAR
jgi:hypothetical protein